MLKEEFLKLLKEDKNFRKEVEELLGISSARTDVTDTREEIRELVQSIKELKEMVKDLEEAQRKSEERMSKLEEKMMELAEAQRKTEEAQRKSEERMSKLEEKMMELAEAQRKMEEVLGTLTRTVGQLTEEMRQMRRDMERMNRTLDSIGRRWGLDYEELIRGFFSDFVKQEGLDFTYVNKFTYKDSTGKYGKKGLKYEIDILAKDDKVYLVEVKSFAEEDDVEWFDRKSDVVIDVLGIKNFVKLFLAVNTTEDTVKVAEELGIRMIYGGIIEERKREDSTGSM